MTNFWWRKRVFGVLCLLSVVAYFSLHWNLVCSNSESQKLIDRLCAEVDRGQAVGNLCKFVCSGALKAQACQPFHLGKEVVFSALFHGTPVYVKGKRSNIFENQEEDIFWKDENGVEHFPTVQEFKNIVKSHLFHNFNITYSEKIFYSLWKYPLHVEAFTEEQNKLLLQLSLKTLWSLLQDSEYVIISVFEYLDLFPEVYGTCGGFYIVEELKAIEYPSLVSRAQFNQFARNIKLALGMLDFLTELDTSLEDPVHLCDVKRDHFGVSDAGKLKYLDVDNVYLKPVIDRSVGDASAHCDNHSDCDFFDCKGMCDLVRHKCFTGVTNNNLQVVCEKVFLETASGFQGGLLTSKHATAALNELVRSCANPSGAKDGTRTPADSSYMVRLKTALKEILSVHAKLNKDSF